MKVSPYLIATLICTLSSVTHAQEKSICPSMCSSERKQCLRHAQAESHTIVHPIITTNNERKTDENLSEYQNRTSADLRSLIKERSVTCDRSYDQCVKTCIKDEQESGEPKAPFKQKNNQ